MPDSKTGDRSFRNQSAEYRDAGIGALGIEALAVRRSSRVLRLVRPRSTFCSDDTVYGTGEEDEGSGGTDEREHYAEFTDPARGDRRRRGTDDDRRGRPRSSPITVPTTNWRIDTPLTAAAQVAISDGIGASREAVTPRSGPAVS